jgi:hypothetical protein
MGHLHDVQEQKQAVPLSMQIAERPSEVLIRML